jgi:ABC-type glycerol-3-phosphate transport system permease component
MKRQRIDIFMYTVLIIGGLVMLYPLIWLVFASLKPSNEVLNSSALLPTKFVFRNYFDGWKMIRPYMFSRFFINTFVMVISCVVGSVIISLFVGYGFARFRFKFRNFWFSVLFITVMLPSTVTLISRYIIFNKVEWINTYLPFIIPSFLGAGHGGGFFIYLMHQFIKGIPSELDEAAKIDDAIRSRLLQTS